jgi:hypothetical protein
MCHELIPSDCQLRQRGYPPSGISRFGDKNVRGTVLGSTSSVRYGRSFALPRLKAIELTYEEIVGGDDQQESAKQKVEQK